MRVDSSRFRALVLWSDTCDAEQSSIARLICIFSWEKSSMLGFQLDFWDYITFAVLFFLGLSFLAILVFILGLPGRIAIARKHPDAEAVNIMGFAGFLAVVPWVQAFIWAFKPTTIIDIRRYPKAEEKATEENIARLTGKAPQEEKPDVTKNEGSGFDVDRKAS
jgi:hypothetical protein